MQCRHSLCLGGLDGAGWSNSDCRRVCELLHGKSSLETCDDEEEEELAHGHLHCKVNLVCLLVNVRHVRRE